MSADTLDVNRWHDKRCARAFWSQAEVPAHQQLLADTADWFDPAPGEHWLDLGCGAGHLSRALWAKGAGQLGGIVAIDCAAANEQVIARLARDLGTDRIAFQHADFSPGLPQFETATVAGVVSGLAIQYAESFCPERGVWTRDGYHRLLGEVWRVLRPGGRFIFSVNVPEPQWLRLGLSGLAGIFRSSRPLRYMRNSLRMLRHGAWLKREARRGRFHFLPEPTVREALVQAGFVDIRSRRSYGGLAYVFRAHKLHPGP
jgi:ubiquinone/menaquinone biosynthesis C-methylase UbiE